MYRKRQVGVRRNNSFTTTERAKASLTWKRILLSIIGFLGAVAILLLSSMIKLPTAESLFPSSAVVYQSVEEIPVETLKRLDVVMVLGGGVPLKLAEPLEDVQRRCDDAAMVVHLRNETDSRRRGFWSKTVPPSLPVLCLSAGTKHLAQLLSSDGLPVWESTSCAAYLDVKHNLRHNVYVETTSYDTIGNAFFARTSHTDVIGWKRLLVVTSEVRTSENLAPLNRISS